MLDSFYEFRPQNALNNVISPRERYENGERELADLSGKKKQVEVFASETRVTNEKLFHRTAVCPQGAGGYSYSY